MRVRSVLATVVACGSVVAGPVLTAGPAAAADNVCAAVDATTPGSETGRASAPYALLGIDAAQDQVVRFPPAAKTRRCGSP